MKSMSSTHSTESDGGIGPDESFTLIRASSLRFREKFERADGITPRTMGWPAGIWHVAQPAVVLD